LFQEGFRAGRNLHLSLWGQKRKKKRKTEVRKHGDQEVEEEEEDQEEEEDKVDEEDELEEKDQPEGLNLV
jgi:hypothetical protein